MAVNRDPILKKCRALQIDPSHLGIFKESRRSSQKNSYRKMSNYGLQLREKQRAKFIYGVLEKQFENTFVKASKKPGKTGENLLIMLEERLDNVVYRMGLASSRKEARQFVRHGHFTLNGKKANIPSIIVKVGDVVSLKESSRSLDKFKGLLETADTVLKPKWLDVDDECLNAKVVAIPQRDDVDFPFEEQLIIELYSK